MFRRALVEANQYVTDADFNRFGDWSQEGVDRLTKALLVSGRLYKDFQTVALGPTQIEVAPGTVFDAGAMYATLEPERPTIVGYIPLIEGQTVFVTLVAQGQEFPDFNEARTFEVEVPTSGGGVATQYPVRIGFRARLRKAVLSFIPGVAALAPVRPNVPLQAVAIADLLIGSGGILSITRRTESEAPELDELARSYSLQAVELALMAQAIAGLRNDLAALKREMRAGVSELTVAAMQTDLGLIKERLDVPDTGAPYGGDWFLDEDESDTDHVDYKARVEEGIRFPAANLWKGPIGLKFPNDPSLMHAAQGLICPKYTIVDGIKIDRVAGEEPLGGTVYQTMELKEMSMARQVTRYGPWYEVCDNFTIGAQRAGTLDHLARTVQIGNQVVEFDPSSTYNYYTGETVHLPARYRHIWTDTVRDPYLSYTPVPRTIEGVIRAASFILSQDRWVPGVKLNLTRWSAGAEITASLVECDSNGFPIRQRALATTTLVAAQFVKGWTRLPFSRPVQGRAGIYAVVFAVKGDVWISTAAGEHGLNMTLFNSTDGVTFAPDQTKDLCLAVEFCRFEHTQLRVPLDGLNLDGGVHNIAIRTAAIVPTNADARWQLLIGGAYRDMPRPPPRGLETPVPDLFGSGVTPFYDWAVMLSGNEWAMPILDTAQSEVELFRADDDLRHISEELLFGASATQVKVRAVVFPWVAARHTLAARLHHGAGYATLKPHDAVEGKPVVARPEAREFEWTFNFGAPGIDRCKIDFVGTTNNARITFHVERRVHATS